MSKSQTPPFFTQVELKNIEVNERGGEKEETSETQQRSCFSLKKDECLVDSWLNVLKNTIVGVNKKGNFLVKNYGKLQ